MNVRQIHSVGEVLPERAVGVFVETSLPGTLWIAEADFDIRVQGIARVRVRDAPRYALEAYRYEPASGNVNFRIMLTAFCAGENDLIFQHTEIFEDIEGAEQPWVAKMVAEARLRQGDIDVALETWSRPGTVYPIWFFDCARVRQASKLAPAVKVAALQSLEQILDGSLNPSLTFGFSWNVIRCSIWLGEPDLLFRLFEARAIPGWEEGLRTEVLFVNMFHSDGAVLRQDSRFRQIKVKGWEIASPSKS